MTWKAKATIPAHAMFTWESQAVQHPLTGVPHSLVYRRCEDGTFPAGQWIDALLHYDDVGALDAILYHYPFEFFEQDGTRLENRGNTNIWVRPDRRRKGIGSHLVREAVRRWKIVLRNQRYTTDGAGFVNGFMARERRKRTIKASGTVPQMKRQGGICARPGCGRTLDTREPDKNALFGPERAIKVYCTFECVHLVAGGA